MTHRHVAPLAFVVVTALVAVACGGGSATSTSSTVAVDIDTITPAVGITRDAGAEFDEAGLTGEGRSSFVPLNNPEMVRADAVTWLEPGAIVMGVSHTSGASHAYPIQQMAYHHIANTTLAGEPFVVTY